MTSTPGADDAASHHHRPAGGAPMPTPPGTSASPHPGQSSARPAGAQARRASPPRVRSVSDAFPIVRRAVDAVLMVGFGILCFVVAGSGDGGGWLVVAGLASIGWGGYIALARRGYVMPYFVYAIALIFVIYVLSLL